MAPKCVCYIKLNSSHFPLPPLFSPDLANKECPFALYAYRHEAKPRACNKTTTPSKHINSWLEGFVWGKSRYEKLWDNLGKREKLDLKVDKMNFTWRMKQKIDIQALWGEHESNRQGWVWGKPPPLNLMQWSGYLLVFFNTNFLGHGEYPTLLIRLGAKMISVIIQILLEALLLIMFKNLRDRVCWIIKDCKLWCK